jgi:lysozyme family protein
MSYELFEKAWTETGRIEGGYVNDPSDSGGETNWGITKRVARLNGYEGEMRDLSSETAMLIAKSAYWDKLQLDEVEEITGPPIALELFDTGFNMGLQRAGEFLQRCLNALNNDEWRYDDLPVDGDIGPKTLAALDEFAAWRGAEGLRVLLTALNCLQGEFYISLAERRQKDEKFVYGWLLNRVKI